MHERMEDHLEAGDFFTGIKAYSFYNAWNVNITYG